MCEAGKDFIQPNCTFEDLRFKLELFSPLLSPFPERKKESSCGESPASKFYREIEERRAAADEERRRRAWDSTQKEIKRLIEEGERRLHELRGDKLVDLGFTKIWMRG